ncbi:restriction endonuclease subunit S [Planococcus sp. A6]|uniref:restriction endonuclease subunit S n=1 Tax=Planococcus sp. A6 TaxID=2992760 RepID=UPI00237C272A|nr:restriction endonuclease subunit S [Planococcus sp. A6]MDE0583244.1 restriction endonuclease subunit S [Planococcus sp. A6]
MKNKQVPEIRFRNYDDEWEMQKLKDVAKFIRGSFPQPYTNPDWYDEKNGQPFVQVADIGFDLKLNKDTKLHISKIAEHKSRFVEKGKVVVALQGSIETSIGRVAITQYPAFFDRTILIFESYKVDIDNYYFAQVIQKLFHREKERAWGATISTITKEALSEFFIGLPDIEEQRKIGQFLKKLNDTISLHQQELDTLKQTKQGFLQKMFPKEGKSVPEVRFPEFTEKWKICKLGEIVDITMGQSPDGKNYTKNSNDHILVQGNADIKNGWVSPRVWTTQVTKTASKGDIILSVRAPVGDVGKTQYDVVLGRGVAGIKGNEFIFQLLSKMKINGFWTKYSTGSTFESINSTDLKEAMINIPSEVEQIKIGNFFKQLDDVIALHQQELDALKQTKKAFLQKMFV